MSPDPQIEQFIKEAVEAVHKTGRLAEIGDLWLAGVGYLRQGQLELAKEVRAQVCLLEALTQQMAKLTQSYSLLPQRTSLQKARDYSIPGSIGAALGGAAVVFWDYLRRLF